MITDPDEFTSFDAFSSSGVVTTDTFNLWRKKDNGVINVIAGFGANSASESISVNTSTNTISLKVNGVNTTHILNDAVTTLKLAAAAVTEGKIAVGAVTSTRISLGGVITDKIADLNVTTGKIADLAVTTGKIADLAVMTGKIADLAVTGTKIANTTISSGKLIDGSVISTKIADLNVTTGKIADLAVTGTKIANLAVTNGKIGDGAITATKVGGGAITSSKLFGGTAYDAYRIYGVRAFGTVFGGGGFGNCSAEINTTIAPMGPWGVGIAVIHFNWAMPITGYSVMVTGLGNNGDHLFTVTDRQAGYFVVQSIDTKLTNLIENNVAFKDANSIPAAAFGGFMFTLIF